MSRFSGNSAKMLLLTLGGDLKGCPKGTIARSKEMMET